MRYASRICSLVLFAVSFSVAAEPAPAGDLDDTRARILPSAWTNKREYVVGEPVFLQVVFANISTDKSYEIYGHFHPANDFEVRIWRWGEIPRRFTAGLSDKLVPAVSYDLLPRRLHGHRWMLCHEPENRTGFLFEQPGIYTISCRAQLSINRVPQAVPFPQMQVRIVEPTAEQKKALEMIAYPPFMADLQNGKLRDDTVKIWQKLIEDFPRSIWAPYAKMMMVRRAWDEGSGDYEQIAKDLEAILRDYPGFPMREDVYYAYAGCQDRLGKPLDALRSIYRLLREYPTSPHIDASKHLFRKYLYRKGWETRQAPWYLRE